MSSSLEQRGLEDSSETEALLVLLMDIFSEYGFRGTSLPLIEARTGLTKLRLKRMFPGGKDQMATEVLEYIESWFQDEVFDVLEQGKPAESVLRMWRFLDVHFRLGRRVGLIGRFLLDDHGDRFAIPIRRL